MEINNQILHFGFITYGSVAYNEELKLRDRVLRKPLGMSLFDESLVGEVNDYHIGAYIADCLVGVLILTELNNKEVKMRQVAVDDGWRGKGVGGEMVIFAEQYCSDMGYKRIVLNARKTAVNFYEKHGYMVIGSEFIEIGIPHFKMIKEI